MSKTKYSYCPICGQPLVPEEVANCRACKWTHYDNPIPVAVALVSRLNEPNRGICLVKRGTQPFKGEWALPGGYIDKHEIPKVAAVREVKEEAGLIVRLEKLLCVCNPMPSEINQITISYLARVVGGDCLSGEDHACFFSKDDCPKVCFRSHQMLIDKWWEGRFGELTGKDLD